MIEREEQIRYSKKIRSERKGIGGDLKRERNMRETFRNRPGKRS